MESDELRKNIRDLDDRNMDLNKLLLDKRELILKCKKDLNKIQANIKNLTIGDDLNRLKNLENTIDSEVFTRNSNGKYKSMVDFVLTLIQQNGSDIQNPYIIILRKQLNQIEDEYNKLKEKLSNYKIESTDELDAQIKVKELLKIKDDVINQINALHHKED